MLRVGGSAGRPAGRALWHRFCQHVSSLAACLTGKQGSEPHYLIGGPAAGSEAGEADECSDTFAAAAAARRTSPSYAIAELTTVSAAPTDRYNKHSGLAGKQTEHTHRRSVGSNEQIQKQSIAALWRESIGFGRNFIRQMNECPVSCGPSVARFAEGPGEELVEQADWNRILAMISSDK